MTIFNLHGQQVWSGPLYVNAERINLPNIGAGRWIVRMRIGSVTKADLYETK